MVEGRSSQKTEAAAASQRGDAKLVDWLDLPITKGKKVAVVQTNKTGKKEAVTLKQLYNLVVRERERNVVAGRNRLYPRWTNNSLSFSGWEQV